MQNDVPGTECPAATPIRALLLSTAYDGLEPTGQAVYHDGKTIKRKFLSPPLGIYRTAYFTEKALEGRVQIHLIDPMLYGFAPIRDYIETHRPDVIGFSPIRILYGGDRSFMEQVYQATTTISGYHPLFIAGGIDASTAENNLFRYLPWLDLVITGYGEKVLPEILRKMSQKRDGATHIQADELHSIPGVLSPTGSYMPGQPITAQEFHRFATYIGENIPYADYWEYNRQVNPNSLPETPIEIARIHTTSYCPFDCPFCAHQEYVKEQHGRRLFMLSPDELLDMCVRISHSIKARGIYFNDDEMFSGRARIKQFLNLVITAKASKHLPNDLVFYGQTRVDTVDEEILCLAGQASFTYISYGVEAFSDEALACADLRKRFTAAQALTAVQYSLRFVPITNVNLILFYPSVTRHAFVETVEAVCRLLCDSLEQGNKLSVNPFPTVEAYPQAPINAVAQERNYPSQGRYITDADGQTIYLPESYLPLNTSFRRLVEKEKGQQSLLLREAEKIFARLKEDPRWPTHTISRSIGVNGLILFMAAYELLGISTGESDITVRDMEELIFNLIERFEMGGQSRA